MIQDFSSTFDGKQAVRVRAVGFSENGQLKRVVGVVLTCAVVAGMTACVVFSFLIRSSLAELADRQVAKLELIREQQGLHERRNELLSRDNIVLSARTIGLYEPGKRQVRHL